MILFPKRLLVVNPSCAAAVLHYDPGKGNQNKTLVTGIVLIINPLQLIINNNAAISFLQTLMTVLNGMLYSHLKYLFGIKMLSDCFIPGESYWPCNCTKATCISNNTWELVKIVCELPPQPSCTNGLAPVLVKGECCWHWECDCYCTGWGDPHYKTFDGRYYSYQGNCTYVLMEEINKNVDNFGIYIDNYHCDVRDTVSCPRTLIVKHETQEVHITTVRMIPLQIQVTVNNQSVATPYQKYGLKIFKSGINHVVEIPELETNITYNGVAFSIRLPYRLFGYNTQGQCGTCTNNTADDCRLPDGKIIDSCETMADHWLTDDPKKPHCSPSLPTTKAPAIISPSCKPSVLCELMKGSVFEKCRKVINYEDYYAACVFDSCAVPNSQLECASLQSYATVCADQGVCVDWRGHTRNTCPLKCPSHKVYKACGPIEEVTCKSSQVAQNQTSHVEGCFCPDGTMPYGGGVDVCVKICGCVGPDNEPRKFGEIFEFDCKRCICLEGGSGISCKPLECSEQKDKPSCRDEGFYEVTEVSPDNICCNITSCSKFPFCFIYSTPLPLKLSFAITVPGSPVLADKCHTCVCTEKSNSSGLNLIKCERIPCTEKCQIGRFLSKPILNPSEYVEFPFCIQPGKMENDPKNNCTIYSCVSIKGQLISSTSAITCPPFNEQNCKALLLFSPTGIPHDSPSPCSVTQIVDHITHQGCRSVDKVYLTQCEGSCGTFSLYSAEANSMEHKCSCCREAETSKKEVLLHCPNGEFVMHQYLHVDSCECLDSVCTEHNSSENSKV
uniref:Mucin-2 n=1 Tax=Chelydra serpentina TaxID=8475 RepID=A0A8C3T2B8_CHESE